MPVAAAQFGVAYEDEHLLVIDKPAGVVVHPGHGHRRHARAGAGRARRRRAGPRPPRRRAPARPRYLRAAAARARRRAARALQRRCGRARSRASTWRWSRAARPRGAARSTRRSAATAAPNPDLDRHRRPAPGDHALRDRAHAARRHAAAGDARDRADAPDPGASAGDRASGGRRSGVRARRATRAFQAVPARARLAFDHPETGAAMELRAPLPEDLVRALRQASGERADHRCRGT